MHALVNKRCCPKVPEIRLLKLNPFNWYFYSAPSTSALIQRSQRKSPDRKHCWKSFAVHLEFNFRWHPHLQHLSLIIVGRNKIGKGNSFLKLLVRLNAFSLFLIFAIYCLHLRYVAFQRVKKFRCSAIYFILNFSLFYWPAWCFHIKPSCRNKNWYLGLSSDCFFSSNLPW
jgi:hypothetical protein